MAAYALGNLIEDAGKLRAHSKGVPAINLKEVWATMNRYVSANLELKRAIALPNFCRLGWQATRSRGGKVVHRPYFRLADSFCRAHGMDIAKLGPPPPSDTELCPFEDFNFSKAAIRYSNELTKDQVFSGIRQLIHQLGEVISQGRQLSVEFSFGRLTAKDKDVRFSFTAELYAAHGLEVPAGAAEDVEYRPPAATFAAAPSKEIAKGLRLQGNSLQNTCDGAALSARDGRIGQRKGGEKDRQAPWSSRATGVGGQEQHGTGNADMLTIGQDWSNELEDHMARVCKSRASDAPSSAPAATTALCGLDDASCEATWGTQPRHSSAPTSEIGSGRVPATPSHITSLGSSRGRKISARDKAHEDALHRHITALEMRASEALRDRAMERGQQYRGPTDEDSQVSRQVQMRDYADALQKQIEAKAQQKTAAAEAAQQLERTRLREHDNAQGKPERLAPLSEDEIRRMYRRPPPVAQQVQAMVQAEDDASARQCQFQKMQLKMALEEQIEGNRARRDAQKEAEKNREVQLLKEGSQQASVERDMEQALRHQEREVLHAAWREEARFRDIRKAIEAVEAGKAMRDVQSRVQGYVDTGSARPPLAPQCCSLQTPRQQTADSLNSARRASIGAAASLALQQRPIEVA
eukprot:gnl/TRDRNA2_/TRDRNA2_185258_c0_seq1.p1 gnl/TRDRNA2_/TRDRNA2_185258_c0~~gnl/TRDRNA2_/TRDRNA2_185258_c0_seq1.p1  ORF type:complete len:662 (+),score=129.76 gnl/TRDRNA2_/TRDRNA2_185258_c0_seq1:75-1988(+)